MTRTVEYASSTVEKAVAKASRELNIAPEKLKHEIISYGSTGIFGLVGTKKARIRVTLNSGEGAKKRSLKKQTPEPVPVPVAAIKEESLVPTAPPGQGDVPSAPANGPSPEDAAAILDEDSDDYPGAATLACDALQRMIDFISDEAHITVKKDNGRTVLEISGGNSGVLIGKRGQTLEAMQYLVDKIVSKRFEKRIRLEVDVEGYLQNRRDNLQKMALRVADKVKRTGKPVSVGQMNAHDRRIVHISLKKDDQVRTQSMGDGYFRKLVIFPKKGNGPQNQPAKGED